MGETQAMAASRPADVWPGNAITSGDDGGGDLHRDSILKSWTDPGEIPVKWKPLTKIFERWRGVECRATRRLRLQALRRAGMSAKESGGRKQSNLKGPECGFSYREEVSFVPWADCPPKYIVATLERWEPARQGPAVAGSDPQN